MDLTKVSVFLVLFFCLLWHSNGRNVSLVMENEVKAATKCNLFRGSWVHDESYPLYEAASCPYIDDKLNCRKNGRPDSDYEKWRWQPYGSMPRFNAMDLLERLRGKRLMFVGDSTSRNEWESMACLLSTVIPNSKISFNNDGFPLKTFKALDYQASIEYFWAPFLVDFYSNEQGKKIVHLDSVQRNGVYWKGVDILVFESSHWWTHSGTTKEWDMMQIGHRMYAYMDPMKAYKKALNTWVNWVSENINPKESTVFTRTMSSEHYSEEKSKNCYNQMEPFKLSGDLPPVPPQVPMLEYVLKKSKLPINLQYIIRLSDYRVDAHPSVYTTEVTKQQLKNPEANSDCSHWCLPGVPDTWNELLYASLVQSA
uniref:TRICHOME BIREFRINGENCE-like protein n=1 Tax=Cryptomeria japonica TaxID=3369 RepID=A0A1V1FST4_CRYJA|nr:TRICHOME BIREFRINGENCE-like protein [Cryptomeria japonica]